MDPPLPLDRRRRVRTARGRPAARPSAAVGGGGRDGVLPVPAAVVGHLVAQPARLARAARAPAAERGRGRGPRALALLWWVTRDDPDVVPAPAPRSEHSGDLQGRVGGQQQADGAADAPDGRQPQPGEEGAPEPRGQPRDGCQGQEGADEHRERVVVAHHQRGREDLAQVAPLGEEEDREAEGDHAPADDLPGRRLGAELLLGLGLLLVGVPGATQQQDAADEEHRGREDLDDGAGQLGEQPTGRHGDRGLHEERQAHPDPDEQRPEAGRHHERRDEGLVGQLDDEDRAEDDGDGREVDSHGVHPQQRRGCRAHRPARLRSLAVRPNPAQPQRPDVVYRVVGAANP